MPCSGPRNFKPIHPTYSDLLTRSVRFVAIPLLLSLRVAIVGSERESYEATAACHLDQGNVSYSSAFAGAGPLYRGHAELPLAGAQVLRLGFQRVGPQPGDARARAACGFARCRHLSRWLAVRYS